MNHSRTISDVKSWLTSHQCLLQTCHPEPIRCDIHGTCNVESSQTSFTKTFDKIASQTRPYKVEVLCEQSCSGIMVLRQGPEMSQTIIYIIYQDI